MLTWHEANLAALKAELAVGADEVTKSALAVRIEWENLHIGWLGARISPTLRNSQREIASAIREGRQPNGCRPIVMNRG
jgi:hypothetical protein